MPGSLRAFSAARVVARAAVGALAALALSAQAASADTWRATYSVTLIGLPIGTASITGRISATAYHVEADARITGLATVLVKARGAATGSGAIAGGRILAATFATIAANAKMTRTVRMALAGGNVVGVQIAPPIPEKPGRIPVKAQDEHGIVDPVGAAIVPVAAGEPLVSPAACNRSIPIFDGYTRFDIRLTYVGERQVTTKGYHGPVVVCSARYIPIAGHDPKREVTKFMAENRQMEVWLAPITQAHVLVPYRVSVETMIGTTVVEASEFKVGAKN